ncbi:class I adenylate-forming enzyme family protein [Dactylosporangium sp. NPDC000244]|uniref:class I adenylate-forming enzyme family protein n=1 Tax=Dactylosporangium sp. NPDC000244 TaxID=3154365 RepID=UPI00332D27AB
MDLLDAVARHARHRGDRPAIVHDGRTTDYRTLADRVSALVAGFRARGRRPGERVGIATYSGTIGAELYLAAQAAGLQPAMLSLSLKPRLPEITDALGITEVIADGTFADLAAAPEDGTDWARGRGADVVSAIQFTAGSTGVPKAVVRTVGCDVADAWHRSWSYRCGEADRWVVASPFNLSVLSGAARSMFLFGGTLLLMDAFSVEALDEIGAGGVTILPLQAPQWRAVLAAGAAETLVRRGLRTAVATGQLMQQRFLHELAGALAPHAGVVLNYGTSEAGSIAVDRSGQPRFGEPFRVGAPTPTLDVRVTASGGIEVRGESVAPGYLHELAADPAAPILHAARAQGSWFDTGDVGAWAEDGALQVFGRAADAIEVAGRTILPVTVEERLRGLPGVADAVLTPAMTVLIEPSPGTTAASPAELLDAVLPCPYQIRYVERLPRTPAGKTDRVAAAQLHTTPERTL